MNVFVIPSWYPTQHRPHSGIFVREQAEALAQAYPGSNFAISTWGSHNPDLQLWAKDHVRNLAKVLRHRRGQTSETKLGPNLTEYYTPAFTWSRKILRGNIDTIIKANESHLKAFEAAAGPVDVLHAHTAYPAGWVAMHLSARYKVPYLITEHMGPFPFKDFLLRPGQLSPYLQKPLQHAAATVAVSPQQKETLQHWGIPHVQYIPNLTDESFFKPSPGHQKNSLPTTFFTLARLEEGKGIRYLIQAFKLFLAAHPQCRLRIGGGGSCREEYQALVEELAIADKVEWLGVLNRESALEAYRQCDVFVLPSLYENLPLVLLEATACGKPVIGTYCGGPASIINRNNGLLVEPGNVQELHHALLEIYSSYSQYDQEAIRNEFCSRYSRSVVCQQIMEAYHAAVKEHRTKV
ncbi:glycosyltransferase [Pontibacter actiniarum]|uniref:Glycogen synthase n=1 Tax=Pontibacter actiniarum TaxID=323450 RepID=A0A1X9YWH0_9BACT|nr:glycosyltransferase [Pontibacter actiniarum]ARS37286.1 glycogen synthase [Pontibacter actiniarum]